jgi:hypothetical protein
MKFLTESFPIRFLLFLFFAVLAASLLAPLAANDVIPNEADIYNHLAAIVQAAIELSAHQFPLRVATMRGDGWSYPFFQFYVPTSYVYAGLIYKWFTPSNPFIAYKLTIWSALVLGGIYMYRLTYWLTKAYPAAILASVVFLTAPYLNILIGALGAFNEIIAICLIPFVLYYTLRDYADPSKVKYLLLVSLGWYLLITTHIITFIYGAGLIGILLFLLTCQSKQWMSLFRAGIAILFSCAMATWFLAPEILLSNHFMVNTSFQDLDGLMQRSPTLPSILSPTLNKIMNMQQNVVTRAHTALGLPIIVAVGLALYAIFINALGVKKYRFDYYLVPLMVIFFIAFMLLWSPINIWQWLPKSLLVIQYTMRMLAQLIWIGALIFAWALCWLFRNKLDLRHTVVGVLLIFAATNSLLPTLANGPYKIKDIVKKPIMIFNPDAYTIDSNNSTDFVAQIENYQLDTLILNRKLVLNSPFYLPRALLKLAPAPVINIDGYALSKDKQAQYALDLVVDNEVIATLKILKSGPISWKVPLAQMLTKTTSDILPVEFKLRNIVSEKPVNFKNITLQGDKVELVGFLKPDQAMQIDSLISQCKNIKNELTCNIDVPEKITLLRLPMFYYPNLLRVSLNEKSIPYFGVLMNGRILLGVVPEAGTKNVIKAKFVGLQWANIASWISWSLWGLILLAYLWRVVKPKRHNTV